MEQLHRLLGQHGSLIAKSKNHNPDINETAALAAVLHSFYTGVENILKRISIEIDGSAPQGEFWHTELLERMTSSHVNRPAVLSESLNTILQEYLDFRHVFRHAYSFELKWDKMSKLVSSLEDTLTKFHIEIENFINSV
jgi:hypothetical protein